MAILSVTTPPFPNHNVRLKRECFIKLKQLTQFMYSVCSGMVNFCTSNEFGTESVIHFRAKLLTVISSRGMHIYLHCFLFFL